MFKLLWFGRCGREDGRKRAFLARRLVFQSSLARTTCDLLDPKYRHGLSKLTAIAADDSENLVRLCAVQVQALLGSCILELLVEEPLVDLDPREARGLDGLLAMLAIHLAAVRLAQLVQAQ